MAKADLERAFERYEALVAEARQLEVQGDYGRAIQLALEAWHDADDMMKFAKKYHSRTFSSVSCADIVYRLAPLTFDIEALDKAETLLKQYRAIDRNASDDLAQRQRDATAFLRITHTLWCHIERTPGCRQDELRQLLGGEQEQWRSICERWEQMNLIRRVPSGGSYRLYPVTDLGKDVDAKCSRCGTIARGTYFSFLSKQPCGKCNKNVVYVMMVDARCQSGEN